MTLRFALPSNQELLDDTLTFLASCGIKVARRSRSLSAAVQGVPDTVALFQRSADIPAKIEEETADLAVVGLDRFLESSREDGDAAILLDDLGYGRCQLVLAVPEAWVDVSSVYDLADLSVSFREQGKELRVATKYPRLTQDFLFKQGLAYFAMVPAAGAMEAAPLMGYADLISDIVETGTTLRENRLKTLPDGSILASQAVLIGNLRALYRDAAKRETLRIMLELMEARLNAGGFYSLTANVRGESEDQVAQAVLKYPETSGLQGPTVSRVYSKGSRAESWFAITVIADRARLMTAVDRLRAIGASGIIATPTNYVFHASSRAYGSFLERAEKRLSS
jgi:ATP phosphoribosyltransferase